MPRVVVHNKWWIRFLLAPSIVALSVLFWVAAAEMVFGDFDGGIGIRIVIGLLMVSCAYLTSWSGLTSTLLTETFTDTEIRVRRILTTRRVDLATADAITQLKGPGPREKGVPIGRLVVSEGRRRALIDASFMRTEPAMAVLDEWVRHRPDLVEDDTQVRRIFEARGVLTPKAG